MKRIIIYIVVLAALIAVPIKGTDVGRLKPVEVVFVYEDGGKTVIETDTGDKGQGSSAEDALQNLEDTTAGYIYLDTAEYLVITEEAEETIEQLRPKLKQSLQMCYGETSIDLTKVARFLPAHGRLPQLKHWKSGVHLPKLTCFDERMKLS